MINVNKKIYYFVFEQQETGGYYDIDENTPYYYLIEASSNKDANRIASEKTSIYFDGVVKGVDCECCGDRWVRSSCYRLNKFCSYDKAKETYKDIDKVFHIIIKYNGEKIYKNKDVE